MRMVLNLLKKSKDNINTTIEWSSAFYKFLKEALQNLEDLRDNPQSNNSRKYYQNASKAFRQVRKSERIINRYYGRVKEELKEFKKHLPENLKGDLENIQERLKPFEATIISKASFYRGRMLGDFERIGIDLDLLEKKKNPNYLKFLILHLNQLLENLNQLLGEKVTKKSIGIVSFQVALEELRHFLETSKEILPPPEEEHHFFSRYKEKMLEITFLLEKKKRLLDKSIAFLNLPTANFCRKRGEMIEIDGRLEQACLGCVTQELKSLSRMSIEEIKRTIDYFAENYDTKFITVNGRGDPFEPRLRAETLEKVRYAAERWGIKAYVFTAGNDLDLGTCRTLAHYGANVMVSLFGNRFIDADFFKGKQYAHSVRPLQDQAEIAKNLRMLIQAYKESPNHPSRGTTRIGMNYVITESDLIDRGKKVNALKKAANNEGIFFICNTPFGQNSNSKIQAQLEKMAREYSNFHLRHSTAINDQCQMGAGSSATVDYDGTLLRCPYLDNSQGQGKIMNLSEEQRRKILADYIIDRAFPCVMRKHQK